ncbi:MAG: hypothetical protein JO019_03520 [Candidatus Kaiserbacteria bacterium]|nr:hypothetical protein [Candidatus Kaiserbacteria bacterium]
MTRDGLYQRLVDFIIRADPRMRELRALIYGGTFVPEPAYRSFVDYVRSKGYVSPRRSLPWRPGIQLHDAVECVVRI